MRYLTLKNGKVFTDPVDYSGSTVPDLSSIGQTSVDVTNVSPEPRQGWTYDNGVFTAPAPRLVSADELRATRNHLLSQSDWRDLPSYQGSDQSAWRTYRQELRDLPNGYIPVPNPEFPKI
jgi:hypothetical protein